MGPHPPAPTDLAGVDMEVDQPGRLHRCSTFQLGGTCPAVWTCRSPEALCAAVARLQAARRPWVLLGGGSNVLIADAGVPAVVLRYRSSEAPFAVEGQEAVVPACAPLDAVAGRLARAGWDGLLCCTGIPGTVGGAVVGNAGAWGDQIGDHLVSIRLLRPDGERVEVGPADLAFAYRRSILQTSGDIVLSVRLRVEPGDPGRLLAKRDEILAARSARHPDLRTHPCIGSVFRNIEPTSAAGRRQAAGWYLEQAGAKSLRVGGARVFERHANIVVKGPECTAQDVCDLMRRMAAAVQEKFGMRLVREVRFLGPFAGEPKAPPAAFH